MKQFKKKNGIPKTLCFGALRSTNITAKELAKTEKEDFVIIAKRQTQGRGTKGRSFSSTRGGVYLTAVFYYESFAAKDAFLVMAKSATAVCRTLEDYGFSPKIKWPNDVYVEDKKICGILIENVFSGGLISRSEIGIGLNVKNHLPKELRPIATTMTTLSKGRFSVKEVTEKLLGYLCGQFDFSEYQSRVGYLGTSQTLLQGERREEVTPLRVNEDGSLSVLATDGERRVFAAEVSLRLNEAKTEETVRGI